MRRKLQLFLLLLLIAATTETGVRASTDCERWMAAYKAQLAQAKTVKRIKAAHARVKHAAQKKLANYVKKPVAPHPHPAHFVRPRYTRQQILDRFNIACGDLPASRPGNRLVEGKVSPAPFLSEMEPYEPVELASTGDGGFIPTSDVPPYTPGSSDGGGSGGGLPGGPIFGGGGGPGGGGGGGNTPPPPPPPITPVPEPGSIVMVLSGIAGAAGAVRRRLQS